MSKILVDFDRCFDRFCYLHSWYKGSKDKPVKIIVCPVVGDVQESHKHQFEDPVNKYNCVWHFNIYQQPTDYIACDELKAILEKNAVMLTNFYYHPPTHYADMTEEHMQIFLKHQEHRNVCYRSALQILVDMNAKNMSIPKFYDYFKNNLVKDP
jgi:hypothetical protein